MVSLTRDQRCEGLDDHVHMSLAKPHSSTVSLLDTLQAEMIK